MAKAVLISIRPEWVEKILAGEKTLEVRKNRPNMETPFKCYIYCTNSGVAMGMWGKHGKVVGEFVCDKITWLTHIGFSGLPGIRLAAMKNGHTIDDSFDFSKSCLTTPQIEKYLGGKDGYAWHISNLKIYDNPKQLSEFKGLCRVDSDCCACPHYNYTKMECDGRIIKRPPQSWCYAEEQ
jgi:predicted transcriptional regulator